MKHESMRARIKALSEDEEFMAEIRSAVESMVNKTLPHPCNKCQHIEKCQLRTPYKGRCRTYDLIEGVR